MHCYHLTMREIMEAVLNDPSMRDEDALESLASAQAEFLTWT